MLYFLYGADTFRSRAKLREIRAALLQKTEGALVTMLSGQECSGPRLEELCQSTSLFDPKHIIICENVLEDGLSGKEAQEALACSDRSKHVVLLWEGEVSPALAKDVTALATKAQHFTALTGARLRGWVENAAISRGVRLASGEADQLARRYGGDLWGIANTIELRALGMPYDEENTAAQADRFSFPNAFFARRTHAAWIALEELRAEGVGEEEIFWRFVRQLTNALLLKRLSGRFSLAEAAEKSNLHPFAAKKTLEAISGIEERELCRWTEYCIALWQETRVTERAILAGLERLVFSLCAPARSC